MRRHLLASIALILSTSASAEQSVFGTIEAVWASPAGLVVDMQHVGASVVGQPPACGASNGLSFHVREESHQRLVIAAAASNTPIYITGSRNYCGPFDSTHPEVAVQLAESLTWIPRPNETASADGRTRADTLLEDMSRSRE